MATISEWRPYENYVQSGLTDGKFLNAGFTLLAAGPPRLAAIGGQGFIQSGLAQGEVQGADDIVFPIGIVQNFNLSHNRQFNRVFEIGSERSFFISGRTVGQLGLSRIMYHGPSLLRVMYAYYVDTVGSTTIHSLLGDTNPAASVAQRHDVVVPPGYDNLYLNLASDLFSQPVGLLAYFRDSDVTTVGAAFMEHCVLPNHTIATDAQGTIIQENVSVQFERLLPVQVNALAAVNVHGNVLPV